VDMEMNSSNNLWSLPRCLLFICCKIQTVMM